ncbi:myosin heavy chain, cardiac muscle isoform-like isoform X2 [Mya arenaria]|uniref:myosin heavy chain, cardiac muscle isoform-like isoform X2 n=1 Tax=Mya arenaria TaxID=6604 RepID=UPI0022E1A0EC|nr:myosin heavy chain, cardiac muscle isoform-like isoform X2 [Mya arenaria]
MPDHLSISKFPEEITSSSKLPMMQTVHVPVQGDVDIPNKRQMLQTWHSGSGALAGMTIPEIAEDTNEREEETLSHIRELDSTESNDRQDNLMSEASQEEIEKLQQDLEKIKRKAMLDKENAERKEESLLKEAGELQQHLKEARQEKAIALEEMKDTLNRNQRESDKLQKNLENARQKEDELKKELVGLENELRDSRNKESNLAARISTLEQECIELREQGERASSELHEKERELEDSRGELQRVQLDLRVKEETIRKYNVKVEKQREDITKLEAEKRKSSEKIAQLETDLSEKESELNDTLNDLEIESSKQVQERNRIETEKQDINTELNREKTRLEEKIRLLTDLSKRNEDLTLKIRLLNAEKTTLNQENEDNKRKLLKLEAEKTTLRRENEGHKRKIQSLEAEKTTLQKEKTKLAQKVKKLEDAKMDAKWNIVNQEDENFGTAASLQDTRMGISASKVETIHLRKASVAKIKEAGYTAYCFVVSMAVVEAGLVIGDSNNCVKCVDVDGDRVLSSLAMEGQIYDMSSFKEMVAIVWRNLGSVKLGIVTVSSKGNLDLGKIIDVQISLEGPILFTGQGFLVSTVGGKVENIDMDGTRLETLLVMTQSTAIGFLTLSHFNGYVYMCVRNEPLLMCFDKKGNIKGKYEMSESDVRKLGMQVGITVDRRGFVYVLCNKGILRLTYDFAEAICVNDSLNGAATITCSPHDDLLFIGYLESDVAESYKIIA